MAKAEKVAEALNAVKRAAERAYEEAKPLLEKVGITLKELTAKFVEALAHALSRMPHIAHLIVAAATAAGLITAAHATHLRGLIDLLALANAVIVLAKADFLSFAAELGKRLKEAGAAEELKLSEADVRRLAEMFKANEAAVNVTAAEEAILTWREGLQWVKEAPERVKQLALDEKRKEKLLKLTKKNKKILSQVDRVDKAKLIYAYYVLDKYFKGEWDAERAIAALLKAGKVDEDLARKLAEASSYTEIRNITRHKDIDPLAKAYALVLAAEAVKRYELAGGFASLAYTLLKAGEERPLYLATVFAYKPSTAFRYVPKAELDMPSSAGESAERAAKHLEWRIKADPVWRMALGHLGVAAEDVSISVKDDKVVLKRKDGSVIAELKVEYDSKQRVGMIYINKSDKETEELAKALEEVVKELVRAQMNGLAQMGEVDRDRYLGWLASDLSRHKGVYELSTTRLDQLVAVSAILGKEPDSLRFRIYIGETVSIKYVAEWKGLEHLRKIDEEVKGKAWEWLQGIKQRLERGENALAELLKGAEKWFDAEELKTQRKMLKDMMERLMLQSLEKKLKRCKDEECKRLEEKKGEVEKMVKELEQCGNKKCIEGIAKRAIEEAARIVLEDVETKFKAAKNKALIGEGVAVKAEMDDKDARVVASLLYEMGRGDREFAEFLLQALIGDGTITWDGKTLRVELAVGGGGEINAWHKALLWLIAL
ncbi:MAG: hypothetical protein TU35_007430, partial [Thermoproteus sp. AZ2]